MTVDTFGDITVVVSYLWVHRVAPSAFSVLKSKRLFVTTVVVIRTQWFITWNMRSTELPRRLSHLTRFRTMRYQNLEYVKPILNKILNLKVLKNITSQNKNRNLSLHKKTILSCG